MADVIDGLLLPLMGGPLGFVFAARSQVCTNKSRQTSPSIALTAAAFPPLPQLPFGVGPQSFLFPLRCSNIVFHFL